MAVDSDFKVGEDSYLFVGLQNRTDRNSAEWCRVCPFENAMFHEAIGLHVDLRLERYWHWGSFMQSELSIGLDVERRFKVSHPSELHSEEDGVLV